VPFSVESGCKDTTFFQTAKFFFELFFRAAHEWFVGQRFAPEKKFLTGPEKGPENPAKKKKNTAFFMDFGVCLPDKKRYVGVFCCFSDVYDIFIIHVFRKIIIHLSVTQYFTKTDNKGYSPIFLSPVPSASILFHDPPCPAALSQSTGPCPVHWSMRRQRIRTASIYYL
jgi:hypothetical protein